jgi:hypothetical protein
MRLPLGAGNKFSGTNVGSGPLSIRAGLSAVRQTSVNTSPGTDLMEKTAGGVELLAMMARPRGSWPVTILRKFAFTVPP